MVGVDTDGMRTPLIAATLLLTITPLTAADASPRHTPTFRLSPTSGPGGTRVKAAGAHWPAKTRVTLVFDTERDWTVPHPSRPSDPVRYFNTGKAGAWSTVFTVPAYYNAGYGIREVSVRTDDGGVWLTRLFRVR